VTNISGATMASKFRSHTTLIKENLSSSSLIKKIIAYIKDEKCNLQTCASALIFIVSCSILALLKPFNDSCLGHTLSKVCQYTTTNEKMVIIFPFTSMKGCSI